MSTPDRRGMLDRADMALSIRRQCMLRGVARSGICRPPRPANDATLLNAAPRCSPPGLCWLAANDRNAER